MKRLSPWLSRGRYGMVTVSWLCLLTATVGAAGAAFADEAALASPPKDLGTLAPAAGGPAIPDPDPLALTPLLPAPEPAPAKPMTASDSNALGAIVTDLPPSKITPAPGNAKQSTLPSGPMATPIDGEPQLSLSPESKAIANKLPSNIDSKKKDSAKPIDIERAKDTTSISKAIEDAKTEGAKTATREITGMKIEVKNPSLNFDYELEKAYNAIMAGRSDVAIEIYDNVLANDPKNKLALFGLATTYHRAGQIDKARPLYGKLLSIDPDNREALNNFLVLLADEAPQEALAQLEILEKKNPGLSSVPAQMAVIYQKQGDVDKASDKMFKAVALAPENLTYRYNLAILLDKQKKFGEAGKLYRQLLDASRRGEVIPGDVTKIQERLTFISSNRP